MAAISYTGKRRSSEPVDFIGQDDEALLRDLENPAKWNHFSPLYKSKSYQLARSDIIFCPQSDPILPKRRAYPRSPKQAGGHELSSSSSSETETPSRPPVNSRLQALNSQKATRNASWPPASHEIKSAKSLQQFGGASGLSRSFSVLSINRLEVIMEEQE
eukprot:TRINITY_DN1900_c0_g1_i1.p1 TRINITY_DN1900_c0_g1~~TRINITY_DN1900_c0_g1_i1.p1  ORF type:complete len:160 (+),score=28.71 TRINITY_DN1900_c0_g1_i1:91-570(+)